MTQALSEAPTHGIGKILQDNRYIVPPHQRDYAWSPTEVQQLLDDVKAEMEKNSSSYFLGLLVFLTEGERVAILDGQQRLATTTIIFAAIRDWLRQYPDQADEARKIQDWYIGSSELGEKEPTPNLILNTANNPTFVQYVVKGAPIEDVDVALKKLKRHDPNRDLLNSIICCHEWVKKTALEIADPQKAAVYFFTIIKFFNDRIRTVRLTVTDENAAYTLFETLNERGVDLSPLDLVKNFLFKQASGVSNSTLKDMQARWVQMLATLANVKATAFMKAYWTSRHGRIRSNLLFDTFRKEYGDPQKAVSLSIDMLSAAEQYAALDSSQDAIWSSYSIDTRKTVASLKLLGSQQAHPVVLSGLAKFNISEMQKLLLLIEVSIVRFLIIGGGNTGRWEPICASVAEEIFSSKLKNASDVFNTFKAADVYPTDAEFEAAFKVKSERTNQKASYFLRALEFEEQRLAKGKMAGEWEPGAVTVEHILPTNPGRDWDPIIKDDPDIVDECANRLGNRCLLTSINQKLGNRGFTTKKVAFAKSDIMTTKSIQNYTEWNRNSIDRRQAHLATLAKTIWRFK